MTLSHPLLSHQRNQDSERVWVLSRVTQSLEPAGLVPPQGGSFGAGSIVLSPAGNRCAQQPGQCERRNKFGYVTGRPWRLRQGQHQENNLLGAAWAGPEGWAPGWGAPCQEREGKWSCSLTPGQCWDKVAGPCAPSLPARRQPDASLLP